MTNPELNTPLTSADTNSCVTFGLGASDPSEVIRIDAQGFHYRGQFIEDAGEAHRLLVEFLRQHQPTALTTESND